ncbi:hypothetical protein TruAng_007617 [Truncatella angustata]|nr:hypothetical protein TruAng_007617 [Truncatella angustata]
MSSMRGNPPKKGLFQPLESATKDYQDEAETRDSKLKAVWDNQMGDLENKYIPYKNAFVLLLSWHKDIDDLKTDKEVTALEDLFKQKFMYKTIRKTLRNDPRRSAQAQVNRHLAEFVDDHDDTNTLLIVYYAGHGRPGNVPGALRLTGSTSLRTEDDSELHEIVWSSAEHNIKKTRADVLVIFDCCHAGELERNVRGHYNLRAFEFLAATSAKSTTKKPGKESFTSALIWSLTRLVEQGSFSTQELLRTIQNEAPYFPEDQSPRLSERQPSSQRKIMFAPLTDDYVKKATEASKADDEEDFDDEMRQDLLLRFVFDKDITESMVTEIARHMQHLIRDRDIKAKTVSWEGINMLASLRYKNAMVAQPWIRYFSNRLSLMRNRSEASSAEDAIPSKASIVVSDEAVQVSMPSGPSSVDEDFVTTPNPSSSAEPEISEDHGASAGKPLSLDTGGCSVSRLPSFNDRGHIAHTPGLAMPNLRKRGRDTKNDHELSAFAKRGKIDGKDQSVREAGGGLRSGTRYNTL